MKRHFFRYLIIGAQSSGKTYFINNVIIPLYEKCYPNRKILHILGDRLEIPKGVKQLSKDDIPASEYNKDGTLKENFLFEWTGERYIVSEKGIEKFLLKHFINAAFIIDDGKTSILKDKIGDELEHFIYRGRQVGIDFFFIVHSFNKVPPKLFGALNLIQIYKITEGIKADRKQILLKDWSKDIERINAKVEQAERTAHKLNELAKKRSLTEVEKKQKAKAEKEKYYSEIFKVNEIVK